MIGRKDWELQQAILKHNCCDGEASSSDSGTGEIDYEAIYQFQIKKLKDKTLAPILSNAIIPEHYSDVIDYAGTEYSNGTTGVFKVNFDSLPNTKSALYSIIGGVLFMDWTNGDVVFFGEYSYDDGQGGFS